MLVLFKFTSVYSWVFFYQPNKIGELDSLTARVDYEFIFKNQHCSISMTTATLIFILTFAKMVQGKIDILQKRVEMDGRIKAIV